jgi:Na+/H+-dicarboxylate symporter
LVALLHFLHLNNWVQLPNILLIIVRWAFAGTLMIYTWHKKSLTTWIWLDMTRTSVNVIGNTLANCVIARWEGEFDDKKALAFSEEASDAIR